MAGQRVTRRDVMAAGVAAAGAAVAGRWVAPAPAQGESGQTLDFAALAPGDGWRRWTTAGAANLRRSDGQGVLEAGSDVFPCDPRPVAFAVDHRFRDGEISAVVNAGGAGAGLVLRRASPGDYYAALLDDEQHALLILRRSGHDVAELARVAVPPLPGALTLTFAATETRPTHLAAKLTSP